MRTMRLGAVIAGCSLLACGGAGYGTAMQTAPPDAAVPDAMVADAPGPDVAAPDLRPDLAVPDQRVPDAPAPDAPVPDALVPDAPVPDAPVPDAPVPDAPVPDAPVPDGPFVWEDATCALETVRPEKLPYDLYLMLDASFSMLDPTGGGVSKWDAVKGAIAQFLTEPQTAGLSLGLQYFPLVRSDIPEDCLADGECGAAGPCKRARTCAPADTVSLCDGPADCGAGQSCVLLGGCTQSDNYCTNIGSNCGAGDACQAIPGYCLGRDRCALDDYATPEVAIAPLPGVAGPLIASLAARTPDGLSPIGPALAGALAHARARVAADSSRRAAVVLVSDGFPVECSPLAIPDIAAIARAAAQGTPPVPTFVIGVYSVGEGLAATANLLQIAQAGGTAKAFTISAGQDVTPAFLAALNEVSQSALACEYRIPAPSMGQIDFGKVNVQYTAGDGQVTTLGNVASPALCDPQRGGWYYDVNPAGGGTPTEMIACPATCGRLRLDPRGRVDIVLGCRTVAMK